ncbi:MAG TPA: aminoacyl-tRNA hydrolase [Longimicrobiaceae bacterium]|nr:aminoacyl-tRNA hydrolase [Longimicrobiaceae bacterium]
MWLARLRALLSSSPADDSTVAGEGGGVAGLKVIVGLGNPGREYANTRHNVGWWLLDALAEEWGTSRFRADKSAATSSGRVEPFAVRLVKPITFMNRSGSALLPYKRMNAIDITRDLLVIVDDVALEPGRIRFRPDGSAGGHNGLKSVEQALGTRQYPRLRIGVGAKPPQWDLADWVLSPMPKADAAAARERFRDCIAGIRLWMEQGIEPAMNKYNG